MKVMAVTAGRRGGNGEILAKEALMRAEELGAEVRMVNLHDYDITPCSGCESCTVRFTQRHEAPECVYKDKDDMDAIMQEWLSSDGIIAVVPAFSFMPTGLYRVFTDRHLAYEPNFHKMVGNQAYFRHRVGAIIGNGGSTPSWMSMLMESVQITLLTQDIKVVDQMMVNRAPRPGQVLLDEAALARARLLGEHVVKSAQAGEDPPYVGDGDAGWCPACHSNLLSLGRPVWNGPGFKVECPVCHAGGDLVEAADGSWRFEIRADGRSRSMQDGSGAKDHFFEIEETMKKYFARLPEIKARQAKYEAYEVRGVERRKR